MAKRKLKQDHGKQNTGGGIAIHAAKSSKAVDQPQNFKAMAVFVGVLSRKIHDKEKPRYLRDNLDLGCVIAIADLVDCRKIIGTKDEMIIMPGMGMPKEGVLVRNSKIILDGEMEVNGKVEYSLGDYTPGRYAWILENIERIKPVPAKGQQRIWNWDESGWEKCMRRKEQCIL